MYSNVLIGKHEFAAIMGIGWTSCAVDIRITKKVQAVASLWENGDTHRELRKKYQEESANKMFNIASKLLKADGTRELREASGVLPVRSGKRPRMVETKAKQVEKWKRGHGGNSALPPKQRQGNAEPRGILTTLGATIRKERRVIVPSESEQEGSPSESFNLDTLDANHASSEATGSDWVFAEEDEEDEGDEDNGN